MGRPAFGVFRIVRGFHLTMDTAKTPHADDSWLTAGRFALVLGLLIFVTFLAVLLGTRTFVFRDYGLFSYPVAFFHRQSFWRGDLPLWNPFNYCGVPFLAQWNTMTLYPLSLIYLLFPMPWSLSFFCLAHLFWGGLGMYFLACHWTNHRVASAVAGLIFAFNGLILNFLMWPSHVATFSWFPWVLWLVPEGWRCGGRKLLWGSIAATMQMLAGAPETIFLTWVTLFALACGDWVLLRSSRRLIACRLAGVAFLVGLLSAAQLLPFLELLAHSQRDRGYGSSSHDWSIPFWGWANFLVPLFRSSPTRQGVFLQNGQYWTSSYYAGIGTVLLTLVAMRRVLEWRVRLLAALGLLSLVLAWGDVTELHRLLRFCFPGLGFVRYPVKFVILAVAVMPLMAACGLKSLLSSPARSFRFEWICATVLLCLIGVIVAVDCRASTPSDYWHALWQNALSRAVFLAVLLILFVWYFNSTGQRRVVWAGLLVGAFWLDLATHVPNQNPTVPGSVYSPGWARQELRWNPQPGLGDSRVMVTGSALEALKQNWLPNVKENFLRNRLAGEVNCNLLDDVPHVDGFFSLVPGATYRVTELACGKNNHASRGLLDFLGVSQMTAPGALTEWTARQDFMALVTAGQSPVFADDKTTLAALRETNLDLRQVVWLPAEAREQVQASLPTAATVTNLEVTAQKLSFEVECPTPTMAVISQAFYPAWKAYVDERPVKLWRANYAFQALPVPAGRHRLCLVYQDNFFLAGMACSALGIVFWLALWFRPWLRRRRAASPRV